MVSFTMANSFNHQSSIIPPLKNTRCECFAVATPTIGMFYDFYYFIIYINLSFRLGLNDDDDDWALRHVYQPPKRPTHPDMPCHLDASHYSTTRRLITETAEAAAGENQDNNRGLRHYASRPRYLIFSDLFFNTTQMTIDILDISNNIHMALHILTPPSLQACKRQTVCLRTVLQGIKNMYITRNLKNLPSTTTSERPTYHSLYFSTQNI